MNKIYLDNNSTTQIDPEVLKSMIPYFETKYGNPSSKTHAYGWEAEAANEIARDEIASLINSDSNEIIFTSGATESNNIALNSIINFKRKHLITLSTEHKAILDICNQLAKKEIKIIQLNPKKDGIIDLNNFIKNLTKETSIVSIMHANNEIGVIQPIQEIGAICKKNNILLHVDAAQSLGKIPIDVQKMNIDLLSISSHKIYGPKGIGAIYIKNSCFNKVKPIMYGGNQEKNLRPGTTPTPLIVGFGKACSIAKKLMVEESEKILKLRNLLLDELQLNIGNIIINGNLEKRLSGNLNITFPSLKGQSIINSMPEIAISTGSACTSSSPKPSHVLRAIGIDKKLSNSTIRIGIGRFNTSKDIKIAAKNIIKAVKIKG